MARYDFIAAYLLASGRNGTLYVGVSSDLLTRVSQHKRKEIEGFTQKYGVSQLVWFERFFDMPSAIAREKDLKRWRRAWKIRLIEEANPQWRDLHEDLLLPRYLRNAGDR